MPSPRHARTLARRPGFTLVELLVVVGIIAVLMGLLLTVSRKGRESANKVFCANNLRQLGTAFISYAQDHDGRFPAHANVGGPLKEDWIYWENTSGREPAKSPILRYMGKANAEKSLRCPSDDLNDRLRSIGAPYRFTYTMNWFFSSTYGDPTQPKLRLAAISESSKKIMVIEEDEISLDDGNWHPELLGQSLENFLGTRHEKRRKDWQTWQSNPPLQRPDRKDQGNVCFADGHVDFIPRADTWQPMHYDPKSLVGRDATR